MLALVIAGVIIIGGFFSFGLDHSMTLASLVEKRTALHKTVDGFGALSVVIFLLLYAGYVSISAPGSVIFTLAAGALFGPWMGAALSVAASVSGACLLFLIARTALGAPMIGRAGSSLQRFHAGFKRHGANAMLFMRLQPLFPFWLVNLAGAASNIPFRTFFWTTLIGSMPATSVFAFAGARLEAFAQAAEAALLTCQSLRAVGCRLDAPISALVNPMTFIVLAGLSLLTLAPIWIRRIQARRLRISTPSVETTL